jgi:hypothetical protein
VAFECLLNSKGGINFDSIEFGVFRGILTAQYERVRRHKASIRGEVNGSPESDILQQTRLKLNTKSSN